MAGFPSSRLVAQSATSSKKGQGLLPNCATRGRNMAKQVCKGKTPDAPDAVPIRCFQASTSILKQANCLFADPGLPVGYLLQPRSLSVPFSTHSTLTGHLHGHIGGMACRLPGPPCETARLLVQGVKHGVDHKPRQGKAKAKHRVLTCERCIVVMHLPEPGSLNKQSTLQKGLKLAQLRGNIKAVSLSKVLAANTTHTHTRTQ